MTDELHDVRFPGETEEYRAARDELLRAEIDLRQRVERVAELRRALPLGGRAPGDYVFDGAEGPVRLSEMFAPGKDSLVVYSYMYGPAMEEPCPMCTSLIDGLDRYAPSITQRVNLAVVARSPMPRLAAWAERRGWTNVALYSAAENDYANDYHTEDEQGGQWPVCNVFVRRDDGIHHFWSAEMLWAIEGEQPRHVDSIWPLWNLFDLTPEGRGTDWYPELGDAVE